jgi:hypothetical protein
MPAAKRINGVNWEALHKELQAMRAEWRQDMGDMEGRLSLQATALGLRFDAFSQETRDNRQQTGALLSELVANAKSAADQRAQFDGDIRGLRQGLADYKLESARGDKRVGALSALVTAALSTIAAWIGTSR